LKRIFLNDSRAAIVEESSGMDQSRGYDGHKSRTEHTVGDCGGASELIDVIG
jgi:hypothetical protein